jgi:hypothetical protein
MSGLALMNLRRRNPATWVELCQIAPARARLFRARAGTLTVLYPTEVPFEPVPLPRGAHLRSCERSGVATEQEGLPFQKVVLGILRPTVA